MPSCLLLAVRDLLWQAADPQHRLLPLQSFDNISTGAYGETYVATARESLDAPYVALQYSRSFLPVSRLQSPGCLQLPVCTLSVTASASRRCGRRHALSVNAARPSACRI